MLRIKLKNNYKLVRKILEDAGYSCLIGKNVVGATDIVVNENMQYYIIGNPLAPISTMEHISVEKLKKRLNPTPRSNAVPVRIVDTGEEFRSIGECAKHLYAQGLDQSIQNIKGKIIYALKSDTKLYNMTMERIVDMKPIISDLVHMVECVHLRKKEA